MRIRLLCVLMIIAGASHGCGERSDAKMKIVHVSAAASIAYVIEGLAEPIENDLGVVILVNTGASGTLAQQIQRGNRADLFISADPAWIDHLETQGLIDPAARLSLASNQLVFVGSPDLPGPPVTLADLSQKMYQPIAVGEPAYVPAGRYAMQALKAHGLERGPDLELAEAPNVRAALAFVKSGQCPTGLVYASDVRGEAGVDILLKIDPADHGPIRYPAVVLSRAPHREQALRVLAWLKGATAQAALRDAGFTEP